MISLIKRRLIKLPRGGVRKGSGRKPSMEPLKNHSIKFSDLEWKDISNLAYANGMNTSEYIRKILKEVKGIIR